MEFSIRISRPVGQGWKAIRVDFDQSSSMIGLVTLSKAGHQEERTRVDFGKHMVIDPVQAPIAPETVDAIIADTVSEMRRRQSNGGS